jgi:transitional endoplasmic reticulum ATPase
MERSESGVQSGAQSGLQLQVADAKLEDIAEGVARMGHFAFETLGLRQGDFVRVVGDRSILATAHPGAPEDEGLDIVRLDGTQRRKLGVDVGGFVEVFRYDVRPAERVQLVAIGDSDRYTGSIADLRNLLGDRPLLVGDAIEVAPRTKGFEAQLNVLGLNVAEVVGTTSECGAALFRVASTTPEGVVRIADGTEIELLPSGADADYLAEA